MKDLNYKKNKIESEIASLKQERENYLENIKKNKTSKRNMIIYPLLPVFGGIISFVIYLGMYKSLPPIEFYNYVCAIVLAMEAVFSPEEIEIIENYIDSKKELKETSLDEIEKQISFKEQEKIKAKDLEETANLVEKNPVLSNNDSVFKTSDLYLDNTMHFLPETEEKVLVKKFNKGSNK